MYASPPKTCTAVSAHYFIDVNYIFSKHNIRRILPVVVASASANQSPCLWRPVPTPSMILDTVGEWIYRGVAHFDNKQIAIGDGGGIDTIDDIISDTIGESI